MSIHCSYYCAWPNSPPAYNIPSITNQINQSERNPLISFAFHNYSPNKIDEMNGLWYSMVFQFGSFTELVNRAIRRNAQGKLNLGQKHNKAHSDNRISTGRIE